MKRKFNKVSKLLVTAGCVTILSSLNVSAAPLTYDMQQPDVRSDYSAPSKIRLEGDINLGYTKGQKVTLSLRDTDVQQVLRMFADKAGLNIVFHESAKGTVTLDLVDVDLENAFKMVMKMSGLTYVIKDKTMMVASTSSSASLNLSKDNITIVPVKYADAAYLAHFLNTNIFSLNASGLSYGPIVTSNSQKNELLVFGTENDVQMVRKIVDKFDKRPTLTTFKVRHTTPKEMADMICQSLFRLPVTGEEENKGEGVGTMSSSYKAEMKSGENASADNDAVILNKGEIACTLTSSVSSGIMTSYRARPNLTILVQPEVGTITLIGGSEQQIQLVNDFILNNDRKQPQAYLEISIIELSESGSKDFENSWVFNGKNYNISFTNGKFNPVNIVWHGERRHSDKWSLDQTISYLMSNNKARMLSNPKLVITNGKESILDLTRDYVKSTTVQFVQGSSDGKMFAQRTYEIGNDNGIKLSVKPFISPDGYVSITLKPEYSSEFQTIMDVLDGEEYIAATLLQRHDFDLKNVRIKDEETLVLGGFITNDEREVVAKIPVLGDIPILGFLFRNQKKTNEKKELLFILTPRIIKDTEDVANL